MALSKVCSLSEAVGRIPGGSLVGLGGNTFHRFPGAAVHEMVRRRSRGLGIVKTAGSYDVDLLVGAGVADRVEIAYLGFEQIAGIAPCFRRAVEQGRLRLREHTCASVIAGMRAAAQGISFLPLAGMTGSDLVEAGGFRWVEDPYTGERWVAVPAIRPDWAIVHVQEADEEGNARIFGARYEDVLMAQAARHVILTAEKVVPAGRFADRPELTAIPGFLVEAVVEAPRGAWPAACHGCYGPDLDYLRAYVAAARTEAGFEAFVAERVAGAAGRVEAVAP